MSADFTVQLNEILDQYEERVEKAANEAFNEVATEAVQKLKNSSPKLTGKYAKGWKKKKQGDGYVVYNAEAPGLTHLLENGHVIRNQYGSYGRTTAQKHIAPVEQWANVEVEERIRRELE